MTLSRAKRMRGLFVVGTDTGVGKTAVAAAVVRLLGEQGICVGAYKPAASGARWVAGEPQWEDAVALHSALGGRFPMERVCPQRFLAATAPHVAAEREGGRVDPGLLRSGAGWWFGQVEVLVIEGAGGLLSPLSAEDLVADLAVDLGFPLLIVARLGLGTINHTLLTVEAATSRGLEVAGVILNEGAEPSVGDESIESNTRELARICRAPVLAEIRHRPGGDLRQVKELQRIDWNSLTRVSVAASHWD